MESRLAREARNVRMLKDALKEHSGIDADVASDSEEGALVLHPARGATASGAVTNTRLSTADGGPRGTSSGVTGSSRGIALLRGLTRMGNLHPMQHSVATMTTPRLQQDPDKRKPDKPRVQKIHRGDDSDADNDVEADDPDYYAGGGSDSGKREDGDDDDDSDDWRTRNRTANRTKTRGVHSRQGRNDTLGAVEDELSADDSGNEREGGGDADYGYSYEGNDYYGGGGSSSEAAGAGAGAGAGDSSAVAEYQFYDKNRGVLVGWAMDEASGQYYWRDDTQ